VLGLCRSVVNQPQVWICSTGACRNPVAVACMHCIWFVRVVIAAILDKNLKCLRDVSQLRGAQHGLYYTYITANGHIVRDLGISPDHAIRCKLRLHARWLESKED
jgi:hypothetical protein